jgi:hypothetical protein
MLVYAKFVNLVLVESGLDVTRVGSFFMLHVSMSITTLHWLNQHFFVHSKPSVRMSVILLYNLLYTVGAIFQSDMQISKEVEEIMSVISGHDIFSKGWSHPQQSLNQ